MDKDYENFFMRMTSFDMTIDDEDNDDLEFNVIKNNSSKVISKLSKTNNPMIEDFINKESSKSI